MSHYPHIVDYTKHHCVEGDGRLHVVGVVSNSVRYQSRWRLAKEWIEYMAQQKNVVLHIVETAFGHRHHEVAELCHSLGVDYVGFRTKSSIWIKENMINLGMERVLVKWPEANYLSWIDMDVFFEDPNWAVETVQQLQHFAVVQPWSECIDMGPRGEGMQMFTAFGKLHQMGVKKQKTKGEPYQYGHCGYAWACTKAFWRAVGGLIDVAILGSGDYIMAWAMIGQGEGTTYGMGEGFDAILARWQLRAQLITLGEVGFVQGLLKHRFHGAKGKRYYQSRNEILAKHKYCPLKDTYHDEQGILQLKGKPELNHEIHKYNLSRDEDGITL